MVWLLTVLQRESSIFKGLRLSENELKLKQSYSQDPKVLELLDQVQHTAKSSSPATPMLTSRQMYCNDLLAVA